MKMNNRLVFYGMLVFIVTAGVFLFPMIVHNRLNNLPEPSDPVDYESIAFQLWKGKGYQTAWGDPEFLAVYQGQKGYAYLQSRTVSDLTAYRPPLLPVMMAGSYFIFGRTIAPIRILNVLSITTACTLCFLLVSKKKGVFSGIFSVILFWTSPYLHTYAEAILTESTACLLVVLITWFLSRFVEENKAIHLIFSGISLGFLVLTRSICVIWLFPLSILVFFLSLKEGKKISLINTGIFISLAFLIQSPWIIRNCVVLNSFMPYGTQGGMNLPAGYSDKAVINQGSWYSLDGDGFYLGIGLDKTGLELEKIKAINGQQRAVLWISEHMDQIPLLAVHKMLDTIRPTSLMDILILLLAVIGIINYAGQKEVSIFLGIILINLLAVGITYSASVRFLIPVMPILYLLGGVGLNYLLTSLCHFRNRINATIYG